MDSYDFSGWATRNNILCSDGRTIMKDAFKQNDGQKVPLVWNHQHDDPSEVLGHALLENRDEGVYAYCKFNDTESGRNAKALVVNQDVDKLSIYANKLKSERNNVIHGCIREVSLVLAGANPGAFIDSVLTHSEDGEEEEEGVIYTDEQIEINTGEQPEEQPEETKEETEEKKEEENPEEPEKSEEAKTDDGKEEAKPDENNSEDHVEHSDTDKTIGELLDDLKDEELDLLQSALEDISDGKEISNKDALTKMIESQDKEHQDAIYAAIGSVVDDEEEIMKKKERRKL